MERNGWSFQEIMIIVCHYHWLLLHLLLLVLYFAHTMQHQNGGTFVPQISLYILIYNPNGIKENLDKFFQSYNTTYFRSYFLQFRNFLPSHLQMYYVKMQILSDTIRTINVGRKNLFWLPVTNDICCIPQHVPEYTDINSILP